MSFAQAFKNFRDHIPLEPFHPVSFDLIGHYNARSLSRDISSGLTVGMVALPLAMAFAIASGVTPEAGIYTSIIAGFLILLGLFPAIGLVFSLMPDPVLGGATLLMFGTVAAAGMRIIASQRIDRKAILVIALSFSFGLSVELVPEILSQFPETLRNIFASGITTGGLTAIIANTLIHIEEYQDNKDEQ